MVHSDRETHTAPRRPAHTSLDIGCCQTPCFLVEIPYGIVKWAPKMTQQNIKFVNPQTAEQPPQQQRQQPQQSDTAHCEVLRKQGNELRALNAKEAAARDFMEIKHHVFAMHTPAQGRAVPQPLLDAASSVPNAVHKAEETVVGKEAVPKTWGLGDHSFIGDAGQAQREQPPPPWQQRGTSSTWPTGTWWAIFLHFMCPI